MRVSIPSVMSHELRAAQCTFILLSVLVLCGVQSALAAVAQPFWYDEILTVTLSRLTGVHGIWTALHNAADTHPPLFFVITRFARQVIPADHFGYRFPSVLGLLITVSAVYCVLSKRVSRLSALVGAVLILSTELVAYAYEARPYSLMVACIALAVVAWQRVDDFWGYVPAFAFALGISISIHYYAIFAWPAFMLGEIGVSVSRRCFRVRVWLSLFVGALPLLLYSGLLADLRSYYGQDYWSRPEFKQIYTTYNELFNVASHWGITFVIGVTLIILYSVRNLISDRSSVEKSAFTSGPILAGEQLLALALMWLPVVAVISTKMTHGGLTGRHMLPAVLGFALCVGYAVEKLPYKGRLIVLCLLIANYEGFTVPLVHSALTGSLYLQRDATTKSIDSLIGKADKAGLPLVIGSGLNYLPMTYYALGGQEGKIHVLVDPGLAVQYLHTATADLNLKAIKRYTPLQVEDYREFVSRQHKFMLVSGGDFDWLTSCLIEEKNTLRLITVNDADNVSVYEVTMHQ
jgi:hypothetical protein